MVACAAGLGRGRSLVERQRLGSEVQFGESLAGLLEQLVLVGRPDAGGERNDQAAGAATGVLTQLSDLHHGPELGRSLPLRIGRASGSLIETSRSEIV